MDTIGSRIRQAREKLGLSQTDIAHTLKITPQAVQQWEDGKTAPRGARLDALADYLGRSKAWLSFGDEESMPPAANFRVIDDNDDLDPLCYVKIERFNVKLSAGNGTVEWIPEKLDPLVFRRAWFSKKGFPIEHCKAMYVRGDSMMPMLMDWDTILIDTSDTELVEGEVFAVAFKGKLYVKQIAHYEDGIKLVSLNEKYDPVPVPDAEAERFKCLGRMVWRGG